MEWMSRQKAAEVAGVSLPTLDSWIRAGLPVSRPSGDGGKVLISREDLDNFLVSRKTCKRVSEEN